jgi:hypothetical protein
VSLLALLALLLSGSFQWLVLLSMSELVSLLVRVLVLMWPLLLSRAEKMSLQTVLRLYQLVSHRVVVSSLIVYY